MRVGHRQLVHQRRAVLHRHLDAPAEGQLARVGRMVAACPLGVLAGLDLVPQRDGIGPRGALRGIAVDVVPASVLQGDREDVHDRVVQRLAAGLGVHLLRVVGAGADHVVRVVAGVQDDLRDPRQVGDLAAHPERQVDQRLALVFGAVLLGEAVHDGALRLARFGQRHVVVGLGQSLVARGASREDPRDYRILAFVDRTRRALAAHRPVHRLHRQLAGVRGRIGFPRADLALARLARGDADVQRLLHGPEDHRLLQAEQRADAGGLRRTEMGDVVDPVLMQADRPHQVDLDFVPGRDAANEIFARLLHGLRHRQDRRDVVAGMRVVGGEEGIVHVELAHRRAVRPGRPFGTEALAGAQPEHGGAVPARMAARHVARRDHRMAVDRGHRHRGVVDDAVDDHLRDVALHRHAVGRHAGDLPGQLPLARQSGLRRIGLHVVQFHAPFPPRARQGTRGLAFGLRAV